MTSDEEAFVEDTAPGVEIISDDESVVEVNGVDAENRSISSEEEEEGDEDADDLVAMRGEGRYFGLTTSEDALGPICRKCRGRGHIAAQCKIVICEKCDARDDHFTNQCPKSQRCSNCGEQGHLRANCKNRHRIIYCARCDVRNHNEEHCPLIWRTYRYSRGEIKLPEAIYCYNCGEKGHYGDDCPFPRRIPLRFVDKSAFTGDNLNSRLRQKYKQKSKHKAPPSHPARDSHHRDSESNYRERDSQYRDRDYRDRDSHYRDRDSQYRGRDSQYRGLDSQYRDRDYRDRDSHYRDRDSHYRDRDYDRPPSLGGHRIGKGPDRSRDHPSRDRSRSPKGLKYRVQKLGQQAKRAFRR
ncbi:protein Air1p [Trichomonascus vanleenenianus]|uniref:protein Air1p n=1 Tax=Trichomonascus vanleenenianus TaxID=2268995 RepID=UPI003ECACFB9